MSIQLIYASTTGNTEAVMEKIAEILNEKNIENELNRAEQTSISKVLESKQIIFGTSTWGHGEINPFFDELLAEIKSNDMSGKTAAFVGLGDKAYEPELFNNGIRILKEAFVTSGGTALPNELIIDGDPFAILDTKVPYWTDKIITALNESNKS